MSVFHLKYLSGNRKTYPELGRRISNPNPKSQDPAERAGKSGSGHSMTVVSKCMCCLTLSALIVALCVLAEAQQATNIPRIGFLSNRAKPTSSVPDLYETAFRQGLRDLGYTEGKNILIESRYAEGVEHRFIGFTTELVQSKVNVFVSATIRGIRAAKQATKTIPIVMITTVDPIAAGLVSSLARPGGNITGVTRLTRDLSGKRLELLKETIPGISTVGILWSPSVASTRTDDLFHNYEMAGRELKIELQSLQVQDPNPDLNGAFQSAVKRRVNALVVGSGALTIGYRKQIAELAIKNQIASMCERNDHVESGCLMSYSADEAESFRRAAVFVDKILKGAKPADLPIEQPTKFAFVINLKTTKQIGLNIPPNVLAKADRVIK